MTREDVAAKIDHELTGRIGIDVGFDHYQTVDPTVLVTLQRPQRRAGRVGRTGGDDHGVVPTEASLLVSVVAIVVMMTVMAVVVMMTTAMAAPVVIVQRPERKLDATQCQIAP